jgi:hypothetical protein
MCSPTTDLTVSHRHSKFYKVIFSFLNLNKCLLLSFLSQDIKLFSSSLITDYYHPFSAKILSYSLSFICSKYWFFHLPSSAQILNTVVLFNSSALITVSYHPFSDQIIKIQFTCTRFWILGYFIKGIQGPLIHTVLGLEYKLGFAGKFEGHSAFWQNGETIFF